MGLLYAVQRKLIYFPDSSPVPPAAQAIPGARDVTLSTSDGLELTAWLVPATAPSPAARPMAVLYAPGNGGNRAGRIDIATAIAARGFTVLMLDYRGYGGNPGSPSEHGLTADAEAAYDALRSEGFADDQLIFVGESLGCAVVARLQAAHPPAGMLLRSPFTELADVASAHYPFLPVRLLLRDKYPVKEYVAASDVPTVVAYGAADDIVPTSLSAEVADSAGNLVERLAVSGAGHNDALWFGATLADAVLRLAQAAT